MKMTKLYLALALALTIGACCTPKEETQTDKSATELPAMKEKWVSSTVQGIVTAIVKETREVTLMGSEGNLVTITASEAVERFDEIAVGDVVTFDYLVYVKAEFRQPTAEEIATPLVVVAEAVKAPEGMDPAGALGATMTGVVTIEALNRPFMLATVKGPNGNYLTLPVEDASLMEKLHIGQVLVLTYAEAKVVSLTKM
jgi:hypothetical protein